MAKLTVMYTNAQGLQGNIEKFKDYCSRQIPDVVCLSETKVNDKSEIPDDKISIPGYQLYRCDSRSSYTGGVVIYVKESIKTRSFISKLPSYSTWLLTVKVNDLYLTVVYTQPGKSAQESEEFLEVLSDYISKTLPTDSNSTIVGDFNINLLNVNMTRVQNYSNKLAQLGYEQMIKETTRYDTRLRSSTRIDHVWSNNKNVEIKMINKNVKISDHFIVNFAYETKSSGGRRVEYDVPAGSSKAQVPKSRDESFRNFAKLIKHEFFDKSRSGYEVIDLLSKKNLPQTPISHCEELLALDLLKYFSDQYGISFNHWNENEMAMIALIDDAVGYLEEKKVTATVVIKFKENVSHDDFKEVLQEFEDIKVNPYDTIVTVASTTMNQVENSVTKIIEKIENRFRSDFAKSDLIVYRGSRAGKMPVNNITYQGIIIDDQLKFNDFGNFVIEKMSEKRGKFRKIRNEMNEFEKIFFYRTFIQPHIDYCSFLFRMMDNKVIKQLDELQKNFILDIKMVDSLPNYKDVLEELGIVEIGERIRRNILEIFRYLRDAEESSDDRSNEARLHALKYKTTNGYKKPPYKSTRGRRSFFYVAVTEYKNSSEDDETNENSLQSLVKVRMMYYMFITFLIELFYDLLYP